ncbi:unnamed protein product [Diatraea saccharalis]|uniref:Uncharacterized protein n=1 Tax=Diatraea saccharalis TaxID=40085 RepID=A0A9P0C9A5_9NEOP|nr:unnamed protein product [Diatraea saccharalis]
MSDDFIPLNQSTPVHGKWPRRNQNQRHYTRNNRYQHIGPRRSVHNQNRWSNNSMRNSSFGTDSNCSYGQDTNQSSIDAYFHPSMLEDPWEKLRQRNNSN